MLQCFKLRAVKFLQLSRRRYMCDSNHQETSPVTALTSGRGVNAGIWALVKTKGKTEPAVQSTKLLRGESCW